jgi:hypothetical protein
MPNPWRTEGGQKKWGEDNVHAWAITPELDAYRTARFDQRYTVLKEMGFDARVTAGACPGLSFEWIKRHRQYPNEKPAQRMAWMQKDGVFWQAAEFTKAFNDGGKSNRNRFDSKFPEVLGLSSVAHWKHPSPTDARSAKKLPTYFDPLNKYTIVIAKLTGGVDHLCATYCRGGFLRHKLLTIFDPNFGEFDVKLTSGDLLKFMTAWSDQFKTYVSGRTGESAIKLLTEIEVIPLKPRAA